MLLTFGTSTSPICFSCSVVVDDVVAAAAAGVLARIPCAHRRCRVTRVQWNSCRLLRIRRRCLRLTNLHLGCCDLCPTNQFGIYYINWIEWVSSILLEIACGLYDCRVGDSVYPLPSSSEKASSSFCSDCDCPIPLYQNWNRHYSRWISFYNSTVLSETNKKFWVYIPNKINMWNQEKMNSNVWSWMHFHVYYGFEWKKNTNEKINEK